MVLKLISSCIVFIWSKKARVQSWKLSYLTAHTVIVIYRLTIIVAKEPTLKLIDLLYMSCDKRVSSSLNYYKTLSTRPQLSYAHYILGTWQTKYVFQSQTLMSLSIGQVLSKVYKGIKKYIYHIDRVSSLDLCALKMFM